MFLLKGLMQQLGIEEERLRLEWISAAEGAKFADTVREYTEQIRSKVADIKNVGEGRWGGAITAAKFLEEFVAGKPWVHIDIAGPAFLESPKAWLDAGGTGAYLRTLVGMLAAQNPSNLSDPGNLGEQRQAHDPFGDLKP